MSQQTAEAPLLLTARDIQRQLQIGRDRARKMMADGTLPIIRIGQRRRYVPAAALQQWIALQTARAIS
jgi:excisionase family DNA binding protein